MRPTNLRRGIYSKLAIVLFLIAGGLAEWSSHGAEGEVKTIAIVRDGDSEFFDGIVQGFKRELEGLARDGYRPVFLDEFNAKGELEEVPTQLRRAFANVDVDLVYTAGIVSSARAQAMSNEERNKPVVAGAIEFSNFDNQGVDAKGSSSRSNFTFVLAPRRIPADIAQLARLSGAKKLHVIVDRTVIAALEEDIRPQVQALEKELEVDIEVHPAAGAPEAYVAALPASAKAVYVPILPSLSFAERGRLFELLTARRIFSLSMLGSVDVQKGALAGLSADNSRALFRRMALNAHQIFSGISPSVLPVLLRSNDRLQVNMRTARQIGWSPDYDTLLSAELIGLEDIQPSGDELTLEEAMKHASEANVDTRVARARLQATYWETRSLVTGLRPQLGLNGQARNQSLGNRLNRLAEANATTLSFGAEVSQILYSDRVTSQIRAQKEVLAATELDLESVRLDGIETAGQAYLDCLLTDALFAIDKENLALTVQNLNLARTRADIGAAEASEVFRWLASLAQAKSQLIRSDANRRNARVALNLAVSEPRTRNWTFRDILIADDEYYFMNDVLSSSLRTLSDFEKYNAFIKQTAVARSPEIEALDKNLAAQGILFAERGRRNFLPQVSLSSSLQRLASETRGDFDSQNDWTVGIGFTIPLFEGGLRKTERNRIAAVIEQLKAQRDRALYFVEQRALSGIYNASASHPGIRLAREALAAAQQRYDSTLSKYSLGAATILDLLDAQSQLVSQKQAEASAVYEYLKDMISIQRSMAWFEFSKTPEEKATWSRMMQEFVTAP